MDKPEKKNIPQTGDAAPVESGERTLKKKIGKKEPVEEKKAVKVVATPRADAKTTIKIFEMLEQAQNYKQLKKGVNEVMKVLNKHKAEVVIMAADTDPLELLMNLPSLCEEHSVPYCFVDSTAALGRASGIQRYTWLMQTGHCLLHY